MNNEYENNVGSRFFHDLLPNCFVETDLRCPNFDIPQLRSFMKALALYISSSFELEVLHSVFREMFSFQELLPH